MISNDKQEHTKQFVNAKRKVHYMEFDDTSHMNISPVRLVANQVIITKLKISSNHVKTQK
jgi:hypothetical protein